MDFSHGRNYMFHALRNFPVFLALITVALPGGVLADTSDLKVYSPVVEQGRAEIGILARISHQVMR